VGNAGADTTPGVLVDAIHARHNPRPTMFRNFRIGTRLFAMAGITSVILLIVGWMALNAMQRTTVTLEKSLGTSHSIASVIDHARDSQGELVKQWKEWKDLLIRGHKKEDFEKYLGNFEKQDEIVSKQLAQVRDTLQALGFEDVKLASMIQDH